MKQLVGYAHYPVRREAGRQALWDARKRILDEPRRFNMRFWFVTLNEESSRWDRLVHQPACGTVACLAGNLLLVADGCLPCSGGDVPGRAAHILSQPLDIASSLFYVNEWPRQFGSRYRYDEQNLEAVQQNACLVAELIDYVLEWGIPKPDRSA